MDESLASYLDGVILTIYDVTLDILFYDLNQVDGYLSSPKTDFLEIETSLFYGIDSWRHH